jgi:GMP synthase-like glutamine amidotransferase
MLPIAVVQHEPSVPPGNIAAVLDDRGADYFVVEAWRDPAWPEPGDLGGLVVLGGTMNVDELDRFPFLGKGRSLVAGAIEQAVPVLGVCLGAQMMARALGGDVYRAEPRNALFSKLEIGDDGLTDPLIASFAEGIPVLQFHEDTFTIPPGATPLARSAASGLHQAFRFGERAYAVQFHFEADESILRGWCADIGAAAMAEEWGITSEDLLAQARDHLAAQDRAGRQLFARFLGLVAVPAR